jgi:hypothetical protein
VELHLNVVLNDLAVVLVTHLEEVRQHSLMSFSGHLDSS